LKTPHSSTIATNEALKTLRKDGANAIAASGLQSRFKKLVSGRDCASIGNLRLIRQAAEIQPHLYPLRDEQIRAEEN
jgi:hypothetical protein